jgi:hypothetical protein
LAGSPLRIGLRAQVEEGKMNDTLYVIHSVFGFSFLAILTYASWSLVWREVRYKHKQQQAKRRQ